MLNHIGRSDILFITLDTLRYDVAQALYLNGQLPNLAGCLRLTVGNVAILRNLYLCCSPCVFCRLFADPCSPGVHPRLFALSSVGVRQLPIKRLSFRNRHCPKRFPESDTTQFVLEGPDSLIQPILWDRFFLFV